LNGCFAFKEIWQNEDTWADMEAYFTRRLRNWPWCLVVFNERKMSTV